MLSNRVQNVEASPTLALAAKAKALAKEGKPVINFTAGEPDFPTPEHVKKAGIEAIQNNRTRYTPVGGTPEFKQAVVDLLNKDLGAQYSAANVMINCGAKHTLYNIFQAVCNDGDEVIIISPYWVSYPDMVKLAGGKPVIVAADEEQGFIPDPKTLEAAITSKTKVIVLNSPSNPTGALMDAVTLKGIAELAKKHKLLVVTDEIYNELVYAPAKHVSILHVAPELVDQTIWVGGVSKTYAMTGWRIGYAAGPQEIIGAMTRIQSHSTSNPTSISQDAALAAITGNQDEVDQHRLEFQKRRDRLVQGLNAIPGITCPTPAGAFYAWVNVSALGDSAKISEQWLDEVYVATVPGEGFGCPGWVRFSFATSMEIIDEGIKRLEAWVTERAQKV